MESRFNRLVLTSILVLLIVIAARPYVVERLYSATQPLPVEPRGDLANYERSTIAIFNRVSPSVVQVTGTSEGGVPPLSGGEETEVQSGTGFVWDAAGHVVTNNHVVQGTKMLAVRFASGEVGKATIVGVAPNYDLAVIHIDQGGSLPPSISVGSSGDLNVGQAAFAIGNPFGLDQSLTAGIISALKRRLPTSAGQEIANVIQVGPSPRFRGAADRREYSDLFAVRSHSAASARSLKGRSSCSQTSTSASARSSIRPSS